MAYDYTCTVYDDRYGKPQYVVKGVGEYEASSVLAGQSKVTFLDSFDTLDEAKKAFPEAELTHALLEPMNTFDHLSDEGDLW